MTAADPDDQNEVVDSTLARVHEHWQRAITEAAQERSWDPPRHRGSGGPVPWEEVASLAVERIWADVEPIIRPIADILAPKPGAHEAQAASAPASALGAATTATRVNDVARPWMTADETARLLDTTAHTLRRLAREERSPVLARRIGGRWRFARQDVERFLGAEPPDTQA